MKWLMYIHLKILMHATLKCRLTIPIVVEEPSVFTNLRSLTLYNYVHFCIPYPLIMPTLCNLMDSCAQYCVHPT